MSDRRVQDAVRDQLVAAAAREQPPRRRRPWRLRIAGVFVVAGLGAAAAAQGTGLLSEGKALDRPFPGAVEVPAVRAVDGPQLAISVPGAPYGLGVGVFTSRTGQDCVLAGQTLGAKLGIVRAGRFHPYGADVPGVCIDLDRSARVQDLMHIGAQTLIYGRATTRPPPLLYAGRRYEPRLGPDGSFLFVIDAKVDINRLREAS